MNKSLGIAVWSLAALSLAGLFTPRVLGQAATIGLTASAAHPAVINAPGGKTTITAIVSNAAPAGSKDLAYGIQFQLPYGSSAVSAELLGPGEGRAWTYEFDATKLTPPLQQQFYAATALVMAPDASNHPQSKSVLIEVKNPANPLFIQNKAGMPPSVVSEPTISPEQFAATGGGEVFAAAAPQVIGDPPFDAALDFDYLMEEGSPEISAKNVNLFQGQAPLQEGQDLATAGISPFDVYVDTTHVGTFTKTFMLHFSDEDIPGARPPGSIVRSLTYTFTVLPEPGSGVLLVMGAGLLLAKRNRAGRSSVRGRG